MFCVLFGVISCFVLNYHSLVAGDDNNDKITKEEEVKLSDYDWEVWCKFQPNGYECNKHGGARFYYDIKLDGCKTFSYGGCPTAYNSFATLSACHENCRDSGGHAIRYNLTEKVFCRLQPDFGQCNDYQPMYYFDITTRICKGFSYSGCGGNNNRFINAQLCNNICSSITAF